MDYETIRQLDKLYEKVRAKSMKEPHLGVAYAQEAMRQAYLLGQQSREFPVYTANDVATDKVTCSKTEHVVTIIERRGKDIPIPKEYDFLERRKRVHGIGDAAVVEEKEID